MEEGGKQFTCKLFNKSIKQDKNKDGFVIYKTNVLKKLHGKNNLKT